MELLILKKSKKLLPLFLLTLFTSCFQAPSYNQSRDFPDAVRELYFVNDQSESLSVLNPDTGEIHNTIALTGRAPNDIHYFQGNDLDMLYVVNSLSNSITIYSESSFLQIAEIYLGPQRNPYSLIASPNNSQAWIPNFLAGTVTLIDRQSFQIIDEITVGQTPQGGVYYGSDILICNTGYLSGTFGMGSITVIDRDSRSVRMTINTGEASNPQSLIAIPSLNEIHLLLSGNSGQDDGEILILDATDNYSEKARIFIGGTPSVQAQAVDEVNQVIYLSGLNGIMSYNYSSRTVLHGSEDFLYPRGGVQNNLYGDVIFDSVSSSLFIADFTGDRMLQVDPASGDLLGEWQGGDGVLAAVLVTE